MLQDIGDIVVFGLEEREDRWQRCRKVLHENGITKITRFANQRGENKYKTATDDFIRVLRWSQNNIVFFEDDFELTEGWEEVLKAAWSDLPDKWDLLYLGANLTKSAKKVTNNLVRLRGAWCFHAVIMNRSFVRWVLRNYDVNQRIVFDEWLRIIAEGRDFYMTYPMISYQRESFSDFVGKVVNYNIFTNKYYLRL